ncbi:MAG: DUF4870 domain-containing protein [Saprospirales bacterium]|nr:DUF4870 domain-containing protein [Saprospirales bacterium]MBK6904366.1 DUF4870 domain-containing protein [Saprospirales bacterium]MBK7336491.1 DUF4870 domain-containing protein [Saprospirales bacterium]
MDNEPLDNPGQLSERDERMWATFAHLGIIAGFIIPFGNVLAPLIIWLTQRDKSSYVETHAKEALNFQITVSIFAIGGAILMIIAVGFLLLAIIGIAALVFGIMAAMKANQGEMYEYPFNLRLIK